MKLKGRVVLVTGASEGIGRALVDALAVQGVRVVAVSRNAEMKPNQNDLVVSKNCDITDASAVKRLAEWVATEYGQLDVLVNNAGVWHKTGPLESLDNQTISNTIATNLTGQIYVTRSMLPLLLAAPEAALVQIISKSGVVAQAGQSVYTATKYGMRGFTDVLREDLKGSTVHIMAVYQSGTNTQMFAKAGDTPPLEKFTEAKDLAQHIVQLMAGPAKFWAKELHVDYK